MGIPTVFFEEALHGLVQPGATAFPQAIGLAATWDADLMAAVAAAVAARDREPRRPPDPVPGRQPRPRCPLGPDRGDLRRGPAPGLAHGGRLRRGLREARRHRDAQALRRQRRRRRAGQLSHRRRRARAPRDRARALLRPRSATAGPGRSCPPTIPGTACPASANRRLLTGILKDEWAFRGFVISDANAVGRHVQPAPHRGLLPRVGPAGLGERARRRLPDREIGHAALFSEAITRGLVAPGPRRRRGPPGPAGQDGARPVRGSLCRSGRGGTDAAANRRTGPWPARRPGIPSSSSRTTAAPCRSRGR
ncbi:MAG: hypothetical protein MZV64_52895 [Ignavibacteriales bacterium]|nr:hypothetical protein [Ignavibacteriales bacterium]